jgi:hypothetical protein
MIVKINALCLPSNLIPGKNYCDGVAGSFFGVFRPFCPETPLQLGKGKGRDPGGERQADISRMHHIAGLHSVSVIFFENLDGRGKGRPGCCGKFYLNRHQPAGVPHNNIHLNYLQFCILNAKLQAKTKAIHPTAERTLLLDSPQLSFMPLSIFLVQVCCKRYFEMISAAGDRYFIVSVQG